MWFCCFSAYSYVTIFITDWYKLSFDALFIELFKILCWCNYRILKSVTVISRMQDLLCIVINILVLWFICLSSTFVQWKNTSDDLTMTNTQMFIPLMRFLLPNFVSSFPVLPKLLFILSLHYDCVHFWYLQWLVISFCLYHSNTFVIWHFSFFSFSCFHFLLWAWHIFHSQIPLWLLFVLFWDFFTAVLADGFLLEFEWQQVPWSLQDSSQYSGRSQ